MDVHRDANRNSGAYVGATILIVIGLGALAANLGGGTFVYQSIPLAIGAAFLVTYALTRQYGFLVPGGILTGVGTGLLAASLLKASDAGPYTVLGGGAGFLLIYCLDLLVNRTTTRWWPVIPGGLMVLIGTGMSNQNQDLVRQLQVWSPVLLIAIGLVILATRLWQPKR